MPYCRTGDLLGYLQAKKKKSIYKQKTMEMAGSRNIELNPCASVVSTVGAALILSLWCCTAVSQ